MPTQSVGLRPPTQTVRDGIEGGQPCRTQRGSFRARGKTSLRMIFGMGGGTRVWRFWLLTGFCSFGGPGVRPDGYNYLETRASRGAGHRRVGDDLRRLNQSSGLKGGTQISTPARGTSGFSPVTMRRRRCACPGCSHQRLLSPARPPCRHTRGGATNVPHGGGSSGRTTLAPTRPGVVHARLGA